MNIREELFDLEDFSYGDFQAKLIPGLDRASIIGVRVPDARKLAKRLMRDADISEFLSDLPHKYFDENMVHGLIVSEIKYYDECIEKLDEFLSYADNWVVCDIIGPKIFKKNKTALLEKIKEWSKSEKIYTARFGIKMLMTHFLDDDFKPSYLEIPRFVHSDEYYVKMMVARFFATALAKKWDESVKYIEEKKLDPLTHNKTIQKACESRRISPGQKEYLRSLKFSRKI